MRGSVRFGSLAVCILGMTTVVGADEVSLSRYIVKHDMVSAGMTLTPLDTALMQRFCGDDDGCLVVVRSRGARRTVTS